MIVKFELRNMINGGGGIEDFKTTSYQTKDLEVESKHY
jgi:hypothetical protein